MGIKQYGYPLSGLPSWGVGQEGIYTSSYMLYEGRTPAERRGPWKLFARLTPAEVGQLKAELSRLRFEEARNALEAFAAQRLEAYTAIDPSGTPLLFSRLGSSPWWRRAVAC